MNNNLILRPWKESDCQMIYDWRMDPSVRSKSLNQNEFSYESHKSWFQRFMDNSLSFGFILEDSNTPVAQIRFDTTKTEYCYNISIFTAPNQTGKGYGTSILKLACLDKNLLKFAKQFIAEVFDDNNPSKKVFIKNGFKQISETIVNGRKLLLFKRPAIINTAE